MTIGVPFDQCACELLGILVYLFDHPGLTLELVDRVLQLLVEDASVGNHDH